MLDDTNYRPRTGMQSDPCPKPTLQRAKKKGTQSLKRCLKAHQATVYRASQHVMNFGAGACKHQVCSRKKEQSRGLKLL